LGPKDPAGHEDQAMTEVERVLHSTATKSGGSGPM
jgi:hypothetical protein